MSTIKYIQPPPIAQGVKQGQEVTNRCVLRVVQELSKSYPELPKVGQSNSELWFYGGFIKTCCFGPNNKVGQLLQTHKICFAGRHVFKDDEYQKWRKLKVINSKKPSKKHFIWPILVKMHLFWLYAAHVFLHRLWPNFAYMLGLCPSSVSPNMTNKDKELWPLWHF